MQPESIAAFRVPPRVIFIETVAELIGKTPTTIRTFATHRRYKDRNLIPRPFKMPNSRRLCWYEHEVRQWVESSRQEVTTAAGRKPGRPTKREQLERHRWATGEAAR